jgi:UTP-glucose-1-phosphate uridylyltransferase/mevalonate kinase
MNGKIQAVTGGTIELFVPGRLCLFGEHSDWAGQLRKFNAEILPGHALVVCTEEGIYGEAKAGELLKISTIDSAGKTISAEFPMEISALQAAALEGGFFSYIAGVAAYMLNFHHISGLELNCTKMTLPQKKGLSSSAAICTLTARAFNRIYGLNLTIRGEMEAAYGGEQLTPSRCGRLDQAVAYGSGIIGMTFDADRLDVAPLRVGAPLDFVFADLNAAKDTVTILRDLNTAYPYPKTAEHSALHKLLGGENTRITAAVNEAITHGDAEKIGVLMTEAQNLFKKYAAPLSPKELSSPKLYKILSDKNIEKWIYGGKGVGSQGDGTVQFIAKSADDAINLKQYLKNTLNLDCYSVSVPKTAAIRKAVIPTGGYGTRMYPATKIIKKDFLPVVDTDGRVKPMLLVLLEAVLKSGIEEICLIIRPGEEALYYQLFSQLPEANLRKLPKNFREYDKEISKLRNIVTFAYQEEPLGFGHAVLQSERFAAGEPVMVLLGDHLFSAKDENKSCFENLISAYEASEKLTIGLFELEQDDVSNYGIAKIKSEEAGLFELSALYEKPDINFAKKELSREGKYFGVFMYVITPRVYEALSSAFSDWDGSGELQFTSALDAVTKAHGAMGVAMNGERYDVGLPNQYRRTVAEYGIKKGEILCKI